ncbi:hypothetical protein Dimus_038559 [Dionaea muscipula]
MAPKPSKDHEANLLTSLTMDIERFLRLPACTEEHKKVIDALRRCGLARFISTNAPTWSPDGVIEFYKNTKVKGTTLTSRVDNISVLVKPETLTHHFRLPRTGEVEPLNIKIADEERFWKTIAKDEGSQVNFSCKVTLLKDEFHLLASILSKIVESRTGSHDALTRPRAQLMYAIWKNVPVNWALFVFHRIADQINKETKERLTAENPPKGIFHIKKTFGIIISNLLSLMGVQLKEEMPVHHSKRLFGKAEENKKRRSSSSPVIEKKEKKKIRKLVMSSPSVASSTAPAKGNSTEEVRSSMGEAHEGDQAKGVAQDPPHEAQDPTAAAVAEGEEEMAREGENQPLNIDDSINIDDEIQRFNAWFLWKLSRSRAQAKDMERMHMEDDWIMERVECYELFELIDTGKLLQFFKIGAAAHKRLAIRKGKMPEGESSGGRPDDDDDNDQGHNPDAPQPQPQQPQTQTHSQPPNQPQTQPEPPQRNEEATVEKDDDMDPKDDVPVGSSRGENEDEDEGLNDPIGYNNPISSVNLIATEEDDAHDGKGLELVVYQGPSQFTEAAHHFPTNPSTSNPFTTTTPATSSSHIHAHLNEIVKVMSMRMERRE